MKKIAMAVAFVAVAAFSVAAMAQFGNLPTKVPTNASDAVDVVSKGASKAMIDQELKKAKCSFKNATSTELTCNVKELSDKLAAIVKGAKEAKNWRVQITITADKSAAKKDAMSSYDRGKSVRDQLQSGLAGAVTNKYWNYNIETTDNKGKNLLLSAQVD